MPHSAPKSPRKKPAVAPTPKPEEETKKPPEGFADTDGLSGQGSESVLVHLREIEKRRGDKSDKDSR